MASPVADSKIFRPHVYSLLHLASVQVAIPLCRDMDFWFTVRKCSRDVNKGFSQQILENLSEMICPEGQEYILSIPQHLKKTVLGAAIGLNSAAKRWSLDLFSVDLTEHDWNNLYWRSDGRVDVHKTAYHMVHDTNNALAMRFYLACQYCLEDSAKALWAELKESYIADIIKRSTFSMERFWLERLRTGPGTCWRKSIREFFKRQNNYPIGARYSTFFPSLRPEEREQFLFELCYSCEDDDFLTCLYAMTENEEEKILKNNPSHVIDVLFFYLERPMRSFFLETVKKILKYIDEDDFQEFLDHFFDLMPSEDEDFRELFEGFWNCCPANLRESVKKDPVLNEKIDSFF